MLNGLHCINQRNILSNEHQKMSESEAKSVNPIAFILQTIGPTIVIIVVDILLYPFTRYVVNRFNRRINLHLFTIFGTFLIIFMFHAEAIIPTVMGVIGYFLLELNPIIPIVYAFIFSSAIHIYCMLKVTKGWQWMVDGITMIIFQKIMMTSLDLYHGRKLKQGLKVRPIHSRVALEKKMSLEEWISYIFTPYGSASGPVYCYKVHDYILTIGEKPKLSDESISHKTAFKKFISLPFWILFSFFALKITPISFYKKPFFVNSNVVVRLLLMLVCTFFHTVRYFTAWVSVEAGIYETGVAESGLCDFDDISNLTIFDVLMSKSVGVWLQKWNHSAHIFWKNYFLYPLLDSGVKYSIANPSVFVASALWHGFHPVYYMLLPEMLASTTADRIIHSLFGDTDNFSLPMKVLNTFWVWLSMFDTTASWWYRTYDSYFFVKKSNDYLGTILVFLVFIIFEVLSIFKKPLPKNTKKEESKTKDKSE